MFELLRKRAAKTGQAPGTLQYVGEGRDFVPGVEVIRYSGDTYSAHPSGSGVPDGFTLAAAAQDSVVWFKVCGVHEPELVRRLGQHLDMSRLWMEDVLNTGHRPSLDQVDDKLFLSLKLLGYRAGTWNTQEHVSLVLGPGWVCSFQEAEHNILDAVSERLRLGRGHLRGQGAQYLLAALLDTAVDGYFEVIASMSDEVEDLEDCLLREPDHEVLADLYRLRREAHFLRRTVWPLRDALGRAGKEGVLHEIEAGRLLDDVRTHLNQASDDLATLQSVLSDLLAAFMSISGHRMNQVMKLLTLVATLFIPLTFLAGVWGMNFERMPELGWRWGYPMALGSMALVALVLVLLFRFRRWL
jgi:magnesium transporter